MYRFWSQICGQRKGLPRNRAEMSQSVSPLTTM